MLISFKEFGKVIVSACLTKKSFLVSFLSMACPLTLSWRAGVFWPCKDSTIISSLIVIWYEWLDETLATTWTAAICTANSSEILRTTNTAPTTKLCADSTGRTAATRLRIIFAVPPKKGGGGNHQNTQNYDFNLSFVSVSGSVSYFNLLAPELIF